MILAVTGWRLYRDQPTIWGYLGYYVNRYGDNLRIRVGDEKKGVDRFVAEWCQHHEWPHHIYKADWNRYQSSAGPIRNREMLLGMEEDHLLADLLLAFPQPGVKPRIPGSGTWGCVGEAFTHGIPVFIPSTISNALLVKEKL